MCLQCEVDAQCVLREIIPGYQLYISIKDHEEWPKGQYGLVRCNDPDFVFAIPKDRDDEGEWYDFILYEFLMEPLTGYNFVSACMAAGWNQKEHGDVAIWFVERILERLKKNESQNQLCNE